MRDPRLLAGELGAKSFVVAQILCAGLVLSALVHPLFVATAATLGLYLAWGIELSPFEVGLLIADIASILGGYVSFLALGWWCLKPGERKRFWRFAPAVIPYWIMLSCAAWMAIYDLMVRPHHWHKTRHKPRARLRRQVAR